MASTKTAGPRPLPPLTIQRVAVGTLPLGKADDASTTGKGKSSAQSRKGKVSKELQALLADAAAHIDDGAVEMRRAVENTLRENEKSRADAAAGRSGTKKTRLRSLHGVRKLGERRKATIDVDGAGNDEAAWNDDDEDAGVRWALRQTPEAVFALTRAVTAASSSAAAAAKQQRLLEFQKQQQNVSGKRSRPDGDEHSTHRHPAGDEGVDAHVATRGLRSEPASASAGPSMVVKPGASPLAIPAAFLSPPSQAPALPPTTTPIAVLQSPKAAPTAAGAASTTTGVIEKSGSGGAKAKEISAQTSTAAKSTVGAAKAKDTAAAAWTDARLRWCVPADHTEELRRLHDAGGPPSTAPFTEDGLATAVTPTDEEATEASWWSGQEHQPAGPDAFIFDATATRRLIELYECFGANFYAISDRWEIDGYRCGITDGHNTRGPAAAASAGGSDGGSGGITRVDSSECQDDEESTEKPSSNAQKLSSDSAGERSFAGAGVDASARGVAPTPAECRLRYYAVARALLTSRLSAVRAALAQLNGTSTTSTTDLPSAAPQAAVNTASAAPGQLSPSKAPKTKGTGAAAASSSKQSSAIAQRVTALSWLEHALTRHPLMSAVAAPHCDPVLVHERESALRAAAAAAANVDVQGAALWEAYDASFQRFAALRRRYDEEPPMPAVLQEADEVPFRLHAAVLQARAAAAVPGSVRTASADVTLVTHPRETPLLFREVEEELEAVLDDWLPCATAAVQERVDTVRTLLAANAVLWRSKRQRMALLKDCAVVRKQVDEVYAAAAAKNQ